MSERKQELLDAAIEYAVRHGVAGISLRPLAEAIGSSARLLIFHFKSKEALLEQILAAIHAQLQASLARMAGAERDGQREVPMKQFWRWATQQEVLGRLRVLYEAQFLALHLPQRARRHYEKATAQWLKLIERRLPPSIRSVAAATLCIAVFDGLALEVLASGDHARATQAMDFFIGLLSERASRPAATRRAAPRPRAAQSGKPGNRT